MATLRMVASKENARSAIADLDLIAANLSADADIERYQQVKEFLLAAESKLPTQAAYDRARAVAKNRPR